MFSDALLESLNQGSASLGERLSISDLGYLAKESLRRKYPDSWVRPQVLSPDAIEGDISNIPIFPNPLYRQSERLKAEVAQREQVERLKAKAAQLKNEEWLRAAAAQREEEERLRAAATQREEEERLRTQSADRERNQRRVQADVDRQLADQLYQKLVLELSNGEIKTMVPGLRSVIALNPQHARAHRELANELRRFGQLDEALAESKIAMKLSPTDESSLRLHGVIAGLIGKRSADQPAQLRSKAAVGEEPRPLKDERSQSSPSSIGTKGKLMMVKDTSTKHGWTIQTIIGLIIIAIALAGIVALEIHLH